MCERVIIMRHGQARRGRADPRGARSTAKRIWPHAHGRGAAAPDTGRADAAARVDYAVRCTSSTGSMTRPALRSNQLSA